MLALDALDVGASGLGLLNSAIGVGGLLGAVAAAALIGRARLATDFGFGMLLWGLPLILIALWLEPAFAAVALRARRDRQHDRRRDGRHAPPARRARGAARQGVRESWRASCCSRSGSGRSPPRCWRGRSGSSWALAITGVLLPALTLASWRVLGRIDADARVPERELALLRTLPMFAPLDAPTLEYLAGRLSRRKVRRGRDGLPEGRARGRVLRRRRRGRSR